MLDPIHQLAQAPLSFSQTKGLSLPSPHVEDSLGTSDLATWESFKPSMPTLSPPKTAPAPCPNFYATIQTLIGTLEEIHGTGEKIHLSQSKDLGRVRTKLEEAQKQNLEKIKEAAEKTQASGVWAALCSIGAYLLSAFHAVLGVFLFSEGAALVGGIMLAAGLISIANLAFSTCGFWDWLSKELAQGNKDLEKKLAMILPAVVGITGAALGFVGLGQVWALGNQLDFAQQILRIGQTALGFAQGVSYIGKGVSDYQLKNTHAELVQFQHALARNEYNLESIMSDMQSMMKHLSSCTDSAKRAVQLTIYSNQKTLQI
jgi:hypothetical protein